MGREWFSIVFQPVSLPRKTSLSIAGPLNLVCCVSRLSPFASFDPRKPLYAICSQVNATSSAFTRIESTRSMYKYILEKPPLKDNTVDDKFITATKIISCLQLPMAMPMKIDDERRCIHIGTRANTCFRVFGLRQRLEVARVRRHCESAKITVVGATPCLHLLVALSRRC